MQRTIRKVILKASEMVREYYYSVFPDIEVRKRLESSPGSLAIEPINICNANCIFCAYQYQKRPKQRMADRVFEKAIRDYVELGGGDLYLAVVVGDPLLDSECVERIQYARSFSNIRKIETITNCLNLHKVGAKKLLKSGLNVINVSTVGFDPDMYQRIYRNGQFEQMRENLLSLLRANYDLGRPVKICVGLRIDKPIEDVLRCPDFKEVIELAHSVEANYYFDSWSGRIKGTDLTGLMRMRPSSFVLMKKWVPCGQLWIGIGVLVDGTVTACSCRDLNGDSDLVLGNINERELSELFHSEYLEELKKNWFSGERIPNICQDCSHYFPYTRLMLHETRGDFLTQIAPGPLKNHLESKC